MNKILKVLILLLLSTYNTAYALDNNIPDTLNHSVRFTDRSDMSFQMRGSFNLDKQYGEKVNSKFRIDDFRWNIEGTAGKQNQIYYRFRQSFNSAFKTMSWDNLVSSVNYAFVTWKAFPDVSFTAGKHVFALGGHEFWATPVYVIQFSDFGKSLDAYQMGLSASWQVSKENELVFQVCNLRGNTDNEYFYAGLPEGVNSARFPYIYTFNWNGTFLPEKNLEFRYSASYGHQAVNEDMWVVSLGQSYKTRKWGIYFDLMWSKQGLDASGIISSSCAFADKQPKTARNTEYLSAVAYLHLYLSPSFNVFFKGCGETAGVYKSYMNAAPGLCRVNWNAQGCIQYMPTKDSDFRLFAHYNLYRMTGTNNGKLLGISNRTDHLLSLGLIYIMDVF